MHYQFQKFSPPNIPLLLKIKLIFNTRKALNLIQYLVQENSSDCSVIAELGFPRLMIHLASSDDLEVREAALGGLLELARDGTAGNNIISTEKDQLSQLLQNRIDDIRSMSPDDLRAAREERQLVDSLWSICYNEPSVLRKEGLVVLSGEESFEMPPDVAGRFFEPPLRAWAAKAPPSNEGQVWPTEQRKRHHCL